MDLLGYVRVSTADQASNGHSIERQPELLAAWAQANGHRLVDVIVDGDLGEEGEGARGVSGGRPLASRKGGAELLRRLKAGEADGVVVFSVFRLFRDTLDGLLFFRRLAKPLGKVVFSLSESVDVARASGRFALTLLLATGEYERDVGCERTQAVVQGLRDSGRVYGHVPFGCVAQDGKLYRCPASWPLRQWIVDRRAAGDSLEAIARQLRADGRRAPAGGERWSKSTLAALCQSHADLLRLPELQPDLPPAATGAHDAGVSHARTH